jgi:sigma-E processing peptidase SpoIIGA
MQVYIELALLENFCMDFTLLYSAKAITKNRGRVLRVVFASVFGGVFAVIFPLLPLNNVVAVAVKIFSGALIAFFAGRFKNFKSYLKFAFCFFVLCFLLGGSLLAIFSLTGVEYVKGGGFILSSVPVGVPLFFALMLFIVTKKLAKKFALKCSKKRIDCIIYVGQLCQNVTGFYDSGNSVYHLGNPVSIIDESVAKKLVDLTKIKTFTTIHTVSGSLKMPLFTADKIEIDDDKNTKIIYNVKIGVSPRRIKCAVLHPDLAEG